jgi:antitoxin component HigA of HigAB toxin-antitoxin module
LERLIVKNTDKEKPGAGEYLKLVQVFPLRPIRNRAELERANAILLKLAMVPEETLTRGEKDYFETLTMLVHQAEETTRHRLLSGLSPAEIIKHLMDERGMRVRDLAVAVGNSTAYLILHGRREMSRTTLVRLSNYFGVSPLLFLNSVGSKPKALSA